MARHYILQDWQNAAEYSGQMIGDRLSKSSQLHFKKNGMANIHLYADEEPKKTVKKKSAFEQITLADRHYQRLENLSIQLDEELESGQLSMEDWTYARKQLDVRLDKGWQRLCKLRGWNPEEKDEEIYSLCLEEMEEKQNQKIMQKPVDNAFIEGLSFTHSVIESLSEGNVFKKAFKNLLTAKQKMDKIISTTKQILQE